ncbi:MAG: DUF4956 domain-containing protein [Bacteroidales bacterium]|nr:DUF4956 domain-containing protein [Bacteroidales bacterium]
MEDLELLDTPLIQTGDLVELLVHFGINMLFCWIIIRWLYYPKSQKREYYFTFMMISVSIFLLIYLLGSVKIKIGFALGLFAIFGIIRYRTESMGVREMTYLFVVIAVSVINALAVSLSYAELVAVDVIFILCIKFSENAFWLKNISEKLVLYDRVDLLLPERHEELVRDLEQRLGLNICRVEIGAVDFIRDSAMIKVFYRSDQPNTVNRLLKLPKEHQ